MMVKTVQKKSRSLIKTGIKLSLVIFLFYLLYKKDLISFSATRKALLQWDESLPAMVILFLLTFVGIIRWQWLLYAQNISLKWLRTTQLHFIGQFFNVALPGAVSGDFVKAFYIANEVQGMRGRAFGSILFDRVAGLSALVLVSAGALGVHYRAIEGTPLVKGIWILLSVAASCVVAFYSYLFLVQESHDPLLRGFKALENKFPRTGSLTRIYIGLRHYHSHRWTVLKAISISILIHLSVAWTFVCFARALGDVQIDPYNVFIIVPLGLLINAIPIMPAGIGTGHIAFAALFDMLGSKHGADIFNLFLLIQFFVSAIGGVVYLRFRTHEPKPTLE